MTAWRRRSSALCCRGPLHGAAVLVGQLPHLRLALLLRRARLRHLGGRTRRRVAFQPGEGVTATASATALAWAASTGSQPAGSARAASAAVASRSTASSVTLAIGRGRARCRREGSCFAAARASSPPRSRSRPPPRALRLGARLLGLLLRLRRREAAAAAFASTAEMRSCAALMTPAFTAATRSFTEASMRAPRRARGSSPFPHVLRLLHALQARRKPCRLPLARAAHRPPARRRPRCSWRGRRRPSAPSSFSVVPNTFPRAPPTVPAATTDRRRRTTLLPVFCCLCCCGGGGGDGSDDGGGGGGGGGGGDATRHRSRRRPHPNL